MAELIRDILAGIGAWLVISLLIAGALAYAKRGRD